MDLGPDSYELGPESLVVAQHAAPQRPEGFRIQVSELQPRCPETAFFQQLPQSLECMLLTLKDLHQHSARPMATPARTAAPASRFWRWLHRSKVARIHHAESLWD